MKQTKLDEARAFEAQYAEKISQEERPVFHVTPAVGWLNDPNGFSLYRGEYHLFHQYHPYDLCWGPMHWGHLKSTDLIRWEYLPAAMAPDMEYDKDGVFSGSAVEMPDGRQLLMYTGVCGKDNTPECRQTQCVAVGDGLTYEKYEKNPVFTIEDIPEECFAKDFRDPKIWWDKEENCYFSVTGVRVADGSGAVALFSSEDGFSWKYVTILDYCRNQYGKMWECPDFFELGGKWILLVSPQEMRARGLEFHNGNETISLIGRYDRKTHQFTREHVAPLDHGLDFYAAQTMETPDGRRVLIAWMQAWESSRLYPEYAKWNGMLTIPRELTLREDRLVQQPVCELLKYRKNPVIHKELPMQASSRLSGVSGRILDMTVDVFPAQKDSLKRFTIHLAANDEYDTAVTYDPLESTVCFDRTNAGFCHDIVMMRKAPVRRREGKISIRFIMDRFSVELFINDGEQVMSSCIYTPQEADGIFFEADGSGFFTVEKYELALS